ncbi:MAG: hypothetical protein A3E82_00865 [Gammaproteobacteria bacterium RIFCSPHIGHO2_12_FULL_38_11]|nr:MAG: hypothetical protein A3E82_00865 [Gammaproteobacteria bacterium RIFCSPHIGHO2_12_FULL_38_11]
MKSKINFSVILISTAIAGSVFAGGTLELQNMPYDWSGNYVGVDLGGGWVNESYNFQAGFLGAMAKPAFAPAGNGGSFSQKLSGVEGGMQLGHNWQFRQRWMLGVESEFDGVNFSKTTTNPFSGLTGTNTTYKTTFNWLYTITPRFGVACHHFLFFGKVGLGITNAQSQLNTNSNLGSEPSVFNQSQNLIGLDLGAGIDYALNKWLLGVEYDHINFGHTEFGGEDKPSGTAPIAYNIYPIFNAVKATFGYKFST